MLPGQLGRWGTGPPVLVNEQGTSIDTQLAIDWELGEASGVPDLERGCSREAHSREVVGRGRRREVIIGSEFAAELPGDKKRADVAGMRGDVVAAAATRPQGSSRECPTRRTDVSPTGESAAAECNKISGEAI